MTPEAAVLILTLPPTGSQSRTTVFSFDNPAACILVPAVGLVVVVEVPVVEAGKCNGFEGIRVNLHSEVWYPFTIPSPSPCPKASHLMTDN